MTSFFWNGTTEEGSPSAVPVPAAAWLFGSGLLGMLETDADTEALRQYLNSWWVEWDGRSAGYIRSWRIVKLEFVIFLERLGVSLTPKQRKKLGKRLAALRDDLAEFLTPDSVPVSLSTLASGCEASTA